MLATGSTRRSISATVSARHSTMSSEPDLCASAGSIGARGRITPRIDEQPAVAIFGKGGELVQPVDREAGRLERLESE